MKRNDLLLFAAILCFAGVFYFFYAARDAAEEAVVEIEVEKESYGVYPLAEDARIAIGETNILQIEDGEARMTWADCPDQLCIHQKEISGEDEMIICLPNQVVARVRSRGQENSVDAVVR